LPSRGLAIGTASHGIGTARAFQVNEVAGAFSGLAMGLNALATAVLLPVIWRLMF
jgi:putative effector of murein hydrolase